MSIAHIGGDTALVLCQPGRQGTLLACSSRRRRDSPVYLGRVVPPSLQTRGAIAVLGRLGLFHTTKERQSCLAGHPPPWGTTCHGARHTCLPVTLCASPCRWLPMTIARRMRAAR